MSKRKIKTKDILGDSDSDVSLSWKDSLEKLNIEVVNNAGSDTHTSNSDEDKFTKSDFMDVLKKVVKPIDEDKL